MKSKIVRVIITKLIISGAYCLQLHFASANNNTTRTIPPPGHHSHVYVDMWKVIVKKRVNGGGMVSKWPLCKLMIICSLLHMSEWLDNNFVTPTCLRIYVQWHFVRLKMLESYNVHYFVSRDELLLKMCGSLQDKDHRLV